jgi:TDG/mug DNA glycosylase family protein
MGSTKKSLVVGPRRPTKEEVLGAVNRTVPDVIGRGLRVLFCGINPGLYTAAIGYHFGRPGNRFWRALHLGGFTPRVLSPFEVGEFLGMGYGITNIVARATARAEELSAGELVAGVGPLVRKVGEYRPRFLAVVGVGAYRVAFGRPGARVGEQEGEGIGRTRVWVLPNPSGLNAHYPVGKLGEEFGKLRRAVEEGD